MTGLQKAKENFLEAHLISLRARQAFYGVIVNCDALEEHGISWGFDADEHGEMLGELYALKRAAKQNLHVAEMALSFEYSRLRIPGIEYLTPPKHVAFCGEFAWIRSAFDSKEAA